MSGSGRDLGPLRDAAHARRALRSRALTARRIVDAALSRIDERDGEVRAWAHVDAEGARHAADAADAATESGALHGIPIGVKDVIDVRGMPTRGGAPEIRPDDPSPRDATCVARIRRAGGIILGKTESARYGVMIPGPTRNPHDLSRTPGASSSGSAAAVAAGMVPLAIGTQTAGSVLRPAAYCGVVGFKPTFGVVPTDGVLPLSDSLDTVGCFARTVEDAAMLFAVLADAAPAGTPLRTDARLRVGVFDHRLLGPTSQEVERALDSARRTIAEEHELVELDLDVELLARMGEAQDVVARFGTYRGFHRFGIGEQSPLRPEMVEYLRASAHITPEQVDSALHEADDARAAIAHALADVDVLLSPSAGTEAPPAAQTGTSEFLRPWTLLGSPALSLPAGRARSGLPLAVQLVGHHGHDSALLHAAARIERTIATAPMA